VKFEATKEIYLNTNLVYIKKLLLSDIFAHSLQWLCKGERRGEERRGEESILEALLRYFDNLHY